MRPLTLLAVVHLHRETAVATCLISEPSIITVPAILNPPRCGLNRDLPGLLTHQWSFSSDIARAVSLGGVLLSMQSDGPQKPASVDSEPDFVGYNKRFRRRISV